MTRQCLLLFLFISIGNAQNSGANAGQSNLKTNDSTYADVFPLSIGNQWVYHYDYEYTDIMMDFSDTGTVNVKIIALETMLDSTRWILAENNNHWTSSNKMIWQGPKIEFDTFSIVEITSGNHRLYRSVSASSFNTPVFPFSPTLLTQQGYIDMPKWTQLDLSHLLLRTFAMRQYIISLSNEMSVYILFRSLTE